MSGPSIDLEKPNAIGGLDKLVTNFAISAIAVIPTVLTCIVMPWRLTPLLDTEDPDGRIGMLLAPGAFFPLSLMVSFLLAGLLSTPETVSTNGAFIGPALALSVLSAASEGDIWKIIATIMPIYGVAVILGLVGMCLKPWAGQSWTLRVSLRAAFYIIATLISWMILTGAVIDLIRLSTNNHDLVSALYSFLVIPTAASVIWMYFWFFHNRGSITRTRSGILSVGMLGLILLGLWITELIIRL